MQKRAPQRPTAKKQDNHRADAQTRPLTDADGGRPELQSDVAPRGTAGVRAGRTLDAFPDRIDVRDWLYQPRLTPLPDQIVNCDRAPEILDQGKEGACTGFALAAVVNYLLAQRSIPRSVSPRMVYEMARRYDEWPGEAYEGSSARGAMIGWVRHGVCEAAVWPTHDPAVASRGAGYFSAEIARNALATPGGAYYRVLHRQVRDMHAALHEVGALYCTLMVHDGWDDPDARGAARTQLRYEVAGTSRTRELPVIARRGRASSGHAVAIVGYTRDGFIIQNSWGPSWGAGGFALLPYEDFLLHATDVWVAQLGVPVAIDLWQKGAGMADATSGLGRVTAAVPLSEVRPYVIDIGNNGRLSDAGDYWTTEEDLRRLVHETVGERTKGWEKKRVLLYLHGGLNDEQDVVRRVLAFRDVMLANEIYPIHVMWETSALQSLRGIVSDLFTPADERAQGVGDFFRRFREGLVDAKDMSFELTVSSAGTLLWNEMKSNARLASTGQQAAMPLLAKYVRDAVDAMALADRAQWELHVVGHSAGSIFAAHALPLLSDLGFAFKTLQLLAPAITVADFKQLMLPAIRAGEAPAPSMFLLDDGAERDDTVAPVLGGALYAKSLLYLVSNAFEGRRQTPLLGMERYVRPGSDWADTPPDRDVEQLFAGVVDGHPSLVIAGGEAAQPSASRSGTHGGFDNDPATLNSVMWRILGRAPSRPFLPRDLA